MKRRARTTVVHPVRSTLTAAFASALTLVAFPAVGAAQDCPNADIRAAQGPAVEALPDCMALEMVSPPSKFLMGAQGPSMSVDGDRVLFRTKAGVGDPPGLNDISWGDQYVAARDGSGWTVESTLPPVQDIGSLENLWSDSFAAQSLSPDFSSWFVVAATRDQGRDGVMQAFQGGLGGWFSPLSPLLTPVDSNLNNSLTYVYTTLHGASADHARLFFGTQIIFPVRYGDGDPLPGGVSADGNVYVASLGANGETSVELLARDKAGKVWGERCGARVGGLATDVVTLNGRDQGAISRDGSRVLFATRPGQTGSGLCDGAARLRIMERVEAPSGPDIAQLVVSECDRVAPACDATDGDDLFQGASVDQTKVYFLSSRQLADTDLDGVGAPNGCQGFTVGGCDLYLYDATRPEGQRLTQVSAGDETDTTPGAGAGVRYGIAAVSGDGSHVYFVADGVLTTDPSPSGAVATAGQPNLYAYTRDDEHPDGELAFIGAGHSLDDAPMLWKAPGTFKGAAYPVPVTARDESGVEVGGDGHVLVFFSAGSMTADDTDGGRRDVFRYDADAHELVRVTKAPPGGSDNQQANAVPNQFPNPPSVVGTAFAEISRWVSEDGDTVAFDTEEGLFAADDNGIMDGYLWRNGELHRLPGTARTTVSSRSGSPTVSHDGSMVAFESYDKLSPKDGDAVLDIYVARSGGGFLESPGEDDCEVLAGGCQGGAADTVDSKSNTAAPGDNAVAGIRARLGLSAFPPRALRRAARTGVLEVGVRTNTAGTVRVVARAKVGGRTKRVGRASERTTAAGSFVLAVRLSRPVMRRLGSGRSARVQIVVRQPGAHRRARTVRLPGATS